MKKIGAVLAAMLIMITALPSARAAEPSISAAQAVVTDAATGRVLYGRGENTPALIASTTKIMTGLVVLESCALDERVNVDARSAGAEGSSLYLKAGESLSVETLLYGLLLESGNDAAMALAIHAAGSPEAFAELMNSRAAALGMENTCFSNPSGLDGENHYSTPADMARLMAAAMENPDFARITGASSASLEGRRFSNHNRLLSLCPGVDGGKTGYTRAAGRTLVSTAVRNGHRLVAVTFAAPDDWRDHAALYDWAFEQYRWVSPAADIPPLPVIGSLTRSVVPEPEDEAFWPVGAGEEARVALELPRMLFAPLEKGEPLGAAILFVNGERALETELFCPEDAAQTDVLPPYGIFYFGDC